jgi:hypothetical protein
MKKTLRRHAICVPKEYLKLWNFHLEKPIKFWSKVTVIKNLNYSKLLIPLNSNKKKHDKITKTLNSENAFYYLVEDVFQHFDCITQLQLL